MKDLLISHVKDVDGVSPVILMKLTNRDFEYKLLDIYEVEDYFNELLNTDLSIYYSYLDLIYQDTSSIERCYFILIPEDDIFIEFILSNNDTVIPDDIHEEILEYLSSIYILEEDEEIEDELQNVLGNSVNDTIGNGITSDVINEVGNNNIDNLNTIANNNTVTDNNEVSGTNSVDWNSITSPNNYVFLD